MKSKTVRIALDIALSIMIIVEMFIQYTGVFWHEIIGFTLFATVAAHLALQVKWMKSTARQAKKGKLSGRAIALALIGVLLVVDMTLLGVSSIAISTTLTSVGFTWAFGNLALWSRIHAITSYALCAIVVVHLSLHWVFLASAFKVPYNPARRQAIGTGVHALAAVGAIALGVAAVDKAIPRVVQENGSTPANATTSGTSQNDVQATASSSSASASSQASSGQRGHGRHGDSSTTLNDAGTEAAPTSSISSTSAPGGSTTPNSATGSSSASGICTLCSKHCPLSAPQCDRPYQEGLL